MSAKARTMLLALCLISALSITGCQKGQIRDGWKGTTSPDGMDYQFVSFTGKQAHSIPIEANQKVLLYYDVHIEQGTVTITLGKPGLGTVWAKSFEQDAKDLVTLRVEQGAIYRLEVQGNNSRGSFQVNWAVGSDGD